MHCKLKFVLLLIILLSGYNLKSQDLIVYNNTKNESYLVKYYNNPTQNQTVSNYFIQEIAKSIPKMLNYTQYIYAYTQHARIIKQSNANYNITVDISDANCTGDIYFKGFPMHELLLPSSINYNIKVFNKNNEFLKNFEFIQVPVSDINSRIADFVFADTSATQLTANNTYYILIENKVFSYNANAINNFNAKIKLIEDYFLSDQFIASSLSTIQTIDLQNLELINLFDIKLDEIEQELSKLYNKGFAEKLKLNNYDPIKFVSKIESLSQQVYGLRYNINQILASLDKQYYERGLIVLKSGAVDKAIYNFNKSIEINYYFCPAQYQLALIDYNARNLDNAASRIKEVLAKMYPDYSTQILVKELAQAINEAYLYEGNRLIKSEDYNEALELLEKGKVFCSTTLGISCNEQIFNSIASAKYGIYSSFLSVADKAVESSKFELCEIYLNLAIKYQKENKNDIINTGDIDIVLNKLIAKYIDNGFAMNEQKNYTQALAYFNKSIDLQKQQQIPSTLPRINEGINIAKNGIYQNYLTNANDLYSKYDYNNAENICNQAIAFQKNNSKEITGANEAEILLSKIKYQQYLIIITEGKDFLFSSSYENALNKFEDARKLEANYNFVKANNLDSLMQAAIKPIILKNIEKGNFKLFNGEIAIAQEIISLASSQQTKYKLDSDFDINIGLKSLKDKVFTKECEIAQAEYDKNYGLAQQKIAEKRYLEAGEYLEIAINISIKNVVCGISSTNAEALKLNIMPVINYQKFDKNIEEAFKNNNFGLVIDKYIEAEKYFYQFHIENFNLTHRSLFDYAVSTNNVNFLTYLTDFYTTQNNCNEALALLKELKAKNYPLKKAKLMQENLAKQMAANDYKQNPQSNPKLGVFNYTNGDKWFAFFSKAYIKKWKSIK